MIAPELLELLRCPTTMQRLRPASAELLGRLRRARPAEDFAEALERDDGAVVYPVRDGIPIMLPEEAIAISTLP
jgi:uncharacterized protein YbaR (Trm112 family)